MFMRIVRPLVRRLLLPGFCRPDVDGGWVWTGRSPRVKGRGGFPRDHVSPRRRTWVLPWAVVEKARMVLGKTWIRGGKGH